MISTLSIVVWFFFRSCYSIAIVFLLFFLVFASLVTEIGRCSLFFFRKVLAYFDFSKAFAILGSVIVFIFCAM